MVINLGLPDVSQSCLADKIIIQNSLTKFGEFDEIYLLVVT